MKTMFVALFAAAAISAVPAAAQVKTELAQPITGTRLDINATGKTTRVPNIAVISAGVVTRATTAGAAIQENAERMDRVIAALKRAGVADRDIQTTSINLNPEYRYEENRPPQLVGYSATNQVTVRFREIRNSGSILDALVAEGANQINGPTMVIEQPQAALDEARANAVAVGRQRAELYARALGKRVARIISISESGGYSPPPPMPYAAVAREQSADTKIMPGEQEIEVTLSMVYELQ